MKSLTILLIFMSIAHFSIAQNQENEKVKVWKERGGEVIIEAEHLENRNDMPVFWERSTLFNGYHGTGYLEWTGVEKEQREIPYDSVYKERIVTFFVEIKEEGVYYVKLMGYHEFEQADNEVYVSMKEGAWKTFTINEADRFTCDDNTKEESYPYFLQYGYHKIELIGKRKRFKLDRIILVHEDNVPENREELSADCWSNENESPNEYVERDYF